MNCVDRETLERILRGEAQELSTEALEHVRLCEACRSEMNRLAARSSAAAKFAEMLLGTADCPDYELLSAYVDFEDTGAGSGLQTADTTIGTESYKAVRAHLNLCEACARDVERIRELRSRATLREPVTVRPGASLKHSVWLAPVFRRLAVGVLFAGVVAAVLIGVLPSPTTPPRRSTVAVAPSQTNGPAKVTPSVEPPSGAPRTPEPVPGVTPAPAPSYKVVLVDGHYRLAKQDGELIVLRGGRRISVPPGLLAKMVQKLSTGTVSASWQIAVGMSSIRVRSESENYVPPPTAPKLMEPVGKIVVSDRPTLSWSTVELARSYRVVIKDAQGNTLREHVTAERTYTPSPPLARGQVYIWQVGVRFNDSDEWTMSKAAAFKVLSSEGYAEICRAARLLPGSRLALAVTYESLGLAEEAAREYRLLKRTNPRAKL